MSDQDTILANVIQCSNDRRYKIEALEVTVFALTEKIIQMGKVKDFVVDAIRDSVQEELQCHTLTLTDDNPTEEEIERIRCINGNVHSALCRVIDIIDEAKEAMNA